MARARARLRDGAADNLRPPQQEEPGSRPPVGPTYSINLFWASRNLNSHPQLLGAAEHGDGEPEQPGAHDGVSDPHQHHCRYLQPAQDFADPLADGVHYPVDLRLRDHEGRGDHDGVSLGPQQNAVLLEVGTHPLASC